MRAEQCLCFNNIRILGEYLNVVGRIFECCCLFIVCCCSHCVLFCCEVLGVLSSLTSVADPEGVQGVCLDPLPAPVFQMSYINEIIWSQ